MTDETVSQDSGDDTPVELTREEQVKLAAAEAPLPNAIPLDGMRALQVENAALKVLLLRERIGIMQREMRERMQEQYAAQKAALSRVLPSSTDLDEAAQKYAFDVERSALVLQTRG